MKKGGLLWIRHILLCEDSLTETQGVNQARIIGYRMKSMSREMIPQKNEFQFHFQKNLTWLAYKGQTSRALYASLLYSWQTS
jgi:hypothetical protein